MQYLDSNTTGDQGITGTIPSQIGKLIQLEGLNLGEDVIYFKTIALLCLDIPYDLKMMCSDMLSMHTIWSLSIYFFWFVTSNFFFILSPDLPSIHPNFFSLNQDIMFMMLLMRGMQIKKNLLEKFQHRSETLFHWKNYFWVS